MLRRGVKHELLLLRVLGKVRKCGDTSAVAAAASQSRFEACASLVRDRQVHTAGCQVIPSEGPNHWEIAHTGLFGGFVGRRHPIAIAAAGTGELGEHAAAGSARFMTTTTGPPDEASSSSSTSEAGITAGSDAPDTLHADPAPSSEDAPSTNGAQAAAAASDDTDTTTTTSSAAQAALSADDLLLSDSTAAAAAAGGLTTAEQERQAALAPVLLQAAQEFEAARGHPAKVYVHIKSVDKIRLPGGGLANVRSAGLPVKRTLVTVNRSPHVDKKARDQFEMKVHRHLLVIETQTHRLHHKLAELRNHDLPGVQMKVTFQYQTRLDRSLLA